MQILGIISSLNPEGPNSHYITAKPAFIAKFERYFIRSFLEEIGSASTPIYKTFDPKKEKPFLYKNGTFLNVLAKI